MVDGSLSRHRKPVFQRGDTALWFGPVLEFGSVFALFKRSAVTASAMETLNTPATLCAGRMEYPCVIRQASKERMSVSINRAANISGAVIVVDHARGLAFDGRIGTIRGQDVTLDITASHKLGGLVPARLGRARDIWKRA